MPCPTQERSPRDHRAPVHCAVEKVEKTAAGAVRPFDVVVEPRDDGVVVIVTGDVDVTAAPALRERLIALFMQDGVGAHLVVDLSNVPFIDSTGLGVLVGAHKRAVAAGARMTVIASPAARRSIRLTGLEQAWNVVDAPGDD